MVKDEESIDRRRRWVRVRVILLALVVLGFGGSVLRRAYGLQVSQSSEVLDLVRTQYAKTVHIAPMRGSVYDRYGASLAVSIDAESVWANPRLLRRSGHDPNKVAYLLSRTIDVDRDVIARRLKSDRFFVWIKRTLSPQEVAAVADLQLPGFATTREAKRYYPNRKLASHVVGFSDIDGRGIEGLELSFDRILRGKEQSLPAVLDRRGRVVYSEHLLEAEAMRGQDIVTTLDLRVQHIAEQALGKAVERYRAKSGSVVVLDPRSGEVLALANAPAYDPNHPGDYPAAARRNRAVTDRFEPGSTIKPFTIAGALDRGVVQINERIHCEQGKMSIDDDVIHDSQKWGLLSMPLILSRSSNIGVAKIGARMGRLRLYKTLKKFGFGDATYVPLPGETRGILHKYTEWYELDTATVSFGQGMSVTTLQLALAMGAIANGGVLMKPMLVKQVEGSGNQQRFVRKPQIRHRAASRYVSTKLVQMLVGVTEEGGTGGEASVAGYDVAGKTGTAQKADDRGGYAKDLWVASFVGFVPAKDPRLVIAVIVDEPQVEHLGGKVAGPVFREVAHQSLVHLGVSPG